MADIYTPPADYFLYDAVEKWRVLSSAVGRGFHSVSRYIVIDCPVLTLLTISILFRKHWNIDIYTSTVYVCIQYVKKSATKINSTIPPPPCPRWFEYPSVGNHLRHFLLGRSVAKKRAPPMHFRWKYFGNFFSPPRRTADFQWARNQNMHLVRSVSFPFIFFDSFHLLVLFGIFSPS